MASQGPNSPGTMANVSPGPGNDVNGAWLNVNNAKASDNFYTTPTGSSGSSIEDYWGQLTKDGSAAVGANQITPGVIPGSDAYLTVGGSANLWGTTLSVAEVNASTFGVMYANRSQGGSGTNWLVATNFGFSVPAGSTIDGVVAEIERSQPSTGASQVDHVRITVYYTEAAAGQPAARRFSQAAYCRPVGIGHEGVRVA